MGSGAASCNLQTDMRAYLSLNYRVGVPGAASRQEAPRVARPLLLHQTRQVGLRWARTWSMSPIVTALVVRRNIQGRNLQAKTAQAQVHKNRCGLL